ncbi:hypothetical protein EV207_12530 [Scopulibacillus darangshiensis]|uniref:Uncharacterized protein n=1 Tax=Scopulibacillus darangshiensis TaxID=442528 RepID=A0A4R2NRJ0_9BACL|nr:hypothetical protein [Scopulibacillus darangshiensis]TCP24470.1 hypothetical protein EV207_12530 [Scopulibacillus darangshiensis]
MSHLKIGDMNLNILDIFEHNDGKMEFYYKNINDPTYMSKYWISFEYQELKWNIISFCVYNNIEDRYTDVTGLYSYLITTPLIEGLITYYKSLSKKKSIVSDVKG